MTGRNRNTLKIATRKSPLALWQAEHVKAQLLQHHPEMQVELVTFVTQGDKILDVPLAKIGGKGLFVKELEVALLNGDADMAVHSTKDLPMQLPDGLQIAAFMRREDPSDAFVSSDYQTLDDLPKGAIVGTSSLRRQTQLLAYRPDLHIRSLRGNVGTRLGKLDAGEYHAIILASSGLKRLGLGGRIASTLPFDLSLPAVGQGALAIETRAIGHAGDERLQQLLAPLRCHDTSACVSAERAMNRKLQGGCQVPIAGFAQIQSGDVCLRGRVLNADGSVMLEARVTGVPEQAEAVGVDVAEQLLSQGAGDILAEFYSNESADDA